MPYSKENKRKAKEYVAEVRLRTYCESCGAQPIDWHHEDHEKDGNQRVSRLAARGHPIKRIQQEIEKCEALCRSCHMKEDGRMEILASTHPRQKGDIITEPQPCGKCNKLTKPMWRGMCRSCYDYERRH